MPKYGIDWTKVDEINEPRLAALKPAPKVTAVTEEGANAPAVKNTRAKRTPRKPAEEA